MLMLIRLWRQRRLAIDGYLPELGAALHHGKTAAKNSREGVKEERCKTRIAPVETLF